MLPHRNLEASSYASVTLGLPATLPFHGNYKIDTVPSFQYQILENEIQRTQWPPEPICSLSGDKHGIKETFNFFP
jgi:hypothetical protein